MICELVEALGGKAYLASYNYNDNEASRGAHAASLRAVIGKLASAVIRVMIFIIASIPIMALSFTIGGLNWIFLFIYLVAVFIYAFFNSTT